MRSQQKELDFIDAFNTSFYGSLAAQDVCIHSDLVEMVFRGSGILTDIKLHDPYCSSKSLCRDMIALTQSFFRSQRDVLTDYHHKFNKILAKATQTSQQIEYYKETHQALFMEINRQIDETTLRCQDVQHRVCLISTMTLNTLRIELLEKNLSPSDIVIAFWQAFQRLTLTLGSNMDILYQMLESSNTTSLSLRFETQSMSEKEKVTALSCNIGIESVVLSETSS